MSPERPQPIDAVRELSCKDRRDGLVAVCQERHKSLDEQMTRFNTKQNVNLFMVAGTLVTIITGVLKLFLSK